MKIWRRACAAFVLTLILTGGLLGFWVADYNSRRIAFADTASSRLDVALSEQELTVTIHDTRYRLVWSESLKSSAKALLLLIPPDVGALCGLFEEYVNIE
ncbi:MAG: hypothetical protein J6K98_02745 [Clostridia bacterium]|nr:hypothetical protein [Clostridia bacterium]